MPTSRHCRGNVIFSQHSPETDFGHMDNGARRGKENGGSHGTWCSTGFIGIITKIVVLDSLYNYGMGCLK